MAVDAMHELYMRRCFELAQQADSATKTNPKVGAVIVHQNRIIGEGFHQAFGGPHAEVNAFNSISFSDLPYIPESSIYISLEPCNHFGKTPPCTQQILKHGIKKVYISVLDPNPMMKGKSVNILQDNNVTVSSGILEELGKELIRPYLINNLLERPFVILKFAQSMDGFMGKKEEQFWFSNHASDILVHKWRTEIDGIMVGTNTAITDNPRLTSRLYSGPSPQRIILDRNLRIPVHYHLFTDNEPTWIITENKEVSEANHIEYIQLAFDDEKFLETLLHTLYKRGVTQLMIEGGARLLKSIIQKKLWDEARIFKTKHVLVEGVKAPVIHGKLISSQQILDDHLYIILNPSSL